MRGTVDERAQLDRIQCFPPALPLRPGIGPRLRLRVRVRVRLVISLVHYFDVSARHFHKNEHRVRIELTHRASQHGPVPVVIQRAPSLPGFQVCRLQRETHGIEVPRRANADMQCLGVQFLLHTGRLHSVGRQQSQTGRHDAPVSQRGQSAHRNVLLGDVDGPISVEGAQQPRQERNEICLGNVGRIP